MDRAPYASDPEASRGREFAMAGATSGAPESRGPRSAFQRDRDRVIHSIAFRRLRSKTQVFIAPDGDHYRTRLTHSLEVAQIGRVIARALGLDEDLTEALCLAHDIGHPPFGHPGEKALDAAMHRAGGFDHNAHALRVLMRLESPYPSHDGLNLSWEMLEGMAKHNGPVAQPGWALRQLDEAFSLALGEWPSLEAQVAAVADDIAYDNHDIDDGLRAGFLELDQLLTLDFVADQWREVERRFPNTPRERQLRELVRGQIGLMVNDVLATTRAAAADMTSPDDIRRASMATATFSPGMADEERRLKAFMYKTLYHHPEQIAAADRARDVIAKLYDAYAQDRTLLPQDWRARMPDCATGSARHLGDFLAGMTDRFAIDRYREIYGHRPEGLQNV